MIKVNLISRKCSQCGNDRPLDWFAGKVGTHNGIRRSCKLCRQYHRSWYKEAGGYAYQREKRKRTLNREVPAGHKVCGYCLNAKPDAEFVTAKGKTSARCGECRNYHARWRFNHRRQLSEEKLAKQRERERNRTRQYREKILDAYGRKCACCGETTPEFLALDHVNNDGAEQRRLTGRPGGVATYIFVIAQGFPPDYRLLCHNCNVSHGMYGYCPHEKMAHPIDRALTNFQAAGSVN